MATPHVVGAVAFAAMNFPNENVTERIQRILANVDSVPGLQGMLITGGRLNLQRTVDTDSNGLPDWWEKIYFGHLTGTPPEADPDGDGASNISEWLAGTDPSSAASCFHILDAVRTGNDIRVSWSTVGGHSYVLRFATNAINDPALNFLDLSPVIPVSGTSEGTTNYLHLGGATNSAGYYRVRQD